jgi:hypothetical protein
LALLSLPSFPLESSGSPELSGLGLPEARDREDEGDDSGSESLELGGSTLMGRRGVPGVELRDDGIWDRRLSERDRDNAAKRSSS